MPEGAPTYEDLASLIQRCAGVTVNAETMSHQPDLTFAELGVDSLGVLGVATALENQYGVRLGVDAEQCQRPQQLRALVTNAIAKEANDAGTH
jgi:minimal PKS acyl carrier protein